MTVVNLRDSESKTRFDKGQAISVLDRHKPGGRLNDPGQLELPVDITAPEKESGKRMSNTMVAELIIDIIIRDRDCQARESLHEPTVNDYADLLKEGVEFPPVVAFFDGHNYWLADGFHRVASAIVAGLETIKVEIHEGGKREATFYAIGANAKHGLQRTNADKRRAVILLLTNDLVRIDPETGAPWSDRAIGRKAAVHPTTVATVRASILSNLDSETAQVVTQPEEQPTQRAYKNRFGNITRMDTSRIGRSRPDPKPTMPVTYDVTREEREAVQATLNAVRSGRPNNVISLVDRLDPDESFEAVDRRVSIDSSVDEYREQLEESGGLDLDAIDRPDVRARCIAGAINDLAEWQMTPEEFWAENKDWISRKLVIEELPIALSVLQALKETSDVFKDQVAQEAEAHHARTRNRGAAHSDPASLKHEKE